LMDTRIKPAYDTNRNSPNEPARALP
jgi:hypothetical protein